MDEATRCDRVALMQKGRLLGVDTPGGVVRQYPWKLFSIRASDMFLLMQAALRGPWTVSAHRFGQDIHLSVKDPGVSADDIRRHLSHAGLTDLIVEAADPGIEDCFMDWMGDSGQTMMA